MLLLDSHVLLWYLDDDPRLPAPVRDRIGMEPQVYVSAATIWELRIKQARGKLPLPENLREACTATGLTFLLITPDHAWVAGALPLHHRDPFDRMLVAQAQLDGLTLVTHDARMRPYDVAVLWV